MPEVGAFRFSTASVVATAQLDVISSHFVQGDGDTSLGSSGRILPVDAAGR